MFIFVTAIHVAIFSTDFQEVTSPVSESEEGYYHSTGIDLEQERNGGMYVCMDACTHVYVCSA